MNYEAGRGSDFEILPNSRFYFRVPTGYSDSVQLFTTEQHGLSNFCRSFSLHEYELHGMQSRERMGSYWRRGTNYERKYSQ
jgi:hypothetical protein